MTRLAAGFALVLFLLIVLADTRNLGPLLAVYDFPYGDKISHVVLYGGLTLIAALAAVRSSTREPLRAVLLVSAVMVLLVSLEELSQFAFPARRPDLLDLVASYAGIAWFGALALVIAEVQRATRAPQRIA